MALTLTSSCALSLPLSLSLLGATGAAAAAAMAAAATAEGGACSGGGGGGGRAGRLDHVRAKSPLFGRVGCPTILIRIMIRSAW